MFHMCRVKMKGKTGVYYRGDGTQKLAGVLYLSGISQATSAVHLPAVLCGLAYVFPPSKQAVLHSSEPSAIALSVSHPHRLDSVAEIKAGGYKSGDKSCRSASVGWTQSV